MGVNRGNNNINVT